MTRAAAVITVSTRAAAGVYDDLTGPVIADWCRSRGFTVDALVASDAGVGDAVQSALETRPDLLLTTGGTGIAPDDSTPDAVRPLLSRELPGFGEELRRRGNAVSPHALLSRALAGVAGSTLLVCLPGSTGGVRDGLDLLDGILDHLLDQLRGGHHDG
ncbi:MogA/MoaB family molybdenum cofactor biosynthesis protein [Mycetocola sp. 2940]|uniref:MogA/MoaB family molybdenum cofactor biosynthesis protein n=1 Tax=Mycetocola sp. 2940 TaxID=3156452 RepID=UPI0033934579